MFQEVNQMCEAEDRLREYVAMVKKVLMKQHPKAYLALLSEERIRIDKEAQKVFGLEN